MVETVGPTCRSWYHVHVATRTPPFGSHDAVAHHHMARTSPPQPGPTATWHGPHHRGGSMTTWRRGPHHLSPVPLPGGVLQQPWSRLTEPVGPILSTWRCGSHLTEPAGPVSTWALYSGTVPRPGGTPRQRRPLRSRSHSTVLWATTEYNTLPLWAFAYLLGRLSLDPPRGPSAWLLGRQSSFFPSQPSTTSERPRAAPRPSNNSLAWPSNVPRFNWQKNCVSQDSNRVPDRSQEKALPQRHRTFL